MLFLVSAHILEMLLPSVLFPPVHADRVQQCFSLRVQLFAVDLAFIREVPLVGHSLPYDPLSQPDPLRRHIVVGYFQIAVLSEILLRRLVGLLPLPVVASLPEHSNGLKTLDFFSR